MRFSSLIQRARVAVLCSLGCVVAAMSSGCATTAAPVPLQLLGSGDVESLETWFAKTLDTSATDNRALWLNGLAQMQMLQGKTDDAFRNFTAAGRIMGNWQTDGGEAFAAIVGSESSKGWRGDPFERVMNAFYVGLLYLWRDQPDNARASFKKAILADGESNDESYRSDSALLFWLAGRASSLMGKPNDAAQFFKEAKSAQEFAVQHGSRGVVDPNVLREPGAGNVVCLVDVGLGPEKFAAGDNGELARFRPKSAPATSAEIILNGDVLGRTEIVLDVEFQAATRGGTAMEGIREGKAVFKSVTAISGIVLLNEALKDNGKGARDKAIIGGGLFLLSLMTSATADTRHWETLPSSVQALTAQIPPGTHDLEVRFLDRANRYLPEHTQSYQVDVPESGEAYWFFRSVPGLDRRRNSMPSATAIQSAPSDVSTR